MDRVRSAVPTGPRRNVGDDTRLIQRRRNRSLMTVGAAVIVSMQNYLAQIGAWVTVVQGVIFVICVLAFRRGIIGEIANLIRKPL